MNALVSGIAPDIKLGGYLSCHAALNAVFRYSAFFRRLLCLLLRLLFFNKLKLLYIYLGFHYACLNEAHSAVVRGRYNDTLSVCVNDKHVVALFQRSWQHISLVPAFRNRVSLAVKLVHCGLLLVPCINGFLSEVRIFFLFSQLVKLINKRLRLTLNTIYDLLSLTSCLFKLGFFLIVEFFFLLCKLFSESLAFRMVFLRKPVVFFKLYSCAFKIVYDSFKLSVILRNKRLSVLDYILVDTKTFRDSKSVGLTG